MSALNAIAYTVCVKQLVMSLPAISLGRVQCEQKGWDRGRWVGIYTQRVQIAWLCVILVVTRCLFWKIACALRTIRTTYARTYIWTCEVINYKSGFAFVSVDTRWMNDIMGQAWASARVERGLSSCMHMTVIGMWLSNSITSGHRILHKTYIQMHSTGTVHGSG